MSTMNMNRVTEWERALPAPDELTPLSQSLIPPELACAFNILRPSVSTAAAAVAAATPLPHSASPHALQGTPPPSPLLGMRSALLPTLVSDQNSEAAPPTDSVEEHREGSNTGALTRQQNLDFSSVDRGGKAEVATEITTMAAGTLSSSPNGISPVLNGLSQFMASSWPASSGADVGVPFEDSSAVARGESQLQAGNATSQLKVDPNDEVDSGSAVDSHQSTSSLAVLGEEQSARTLKKPRLVWTPQLHGRFVEAVGQLGIRNAVPKTIMQLMNVEGLTRENVASHLQKYRLYLKRLQQGLPNEGPSASDHLFASTPVPPSLASSGHYLVSHHSHQQDHPFAPSLPNVLSHGNHIPANVTPPTLPFSGFNTHAVFPAVPRTPASAPSLLPTSVVSMPLRDAFPRPPSSPPRRILTLFPTSGS